MEKESAVRIQTSILNPAEKKVLTWLAQRMPRWINSDMLTYIGLGGAVICAVGFFLSRYNLNYLWLSSFGLLVNWYGDSLDGSLARYRHTQRPVYGFFIDHNIDSLTIAIMCIGAGLSNLVSLPVALFVLIGYLIVSIYTYIGAHLKGEFKITYGKLGPTEFRVIVIILNTLLIYLPNAEKIYHFWGLNMTVLDIAGSIMAIALLLIHNITFLKDKRYYSKIDPPKPYNPTKENK